MSHGVRQLVSFIVPTLNRGRYVLRAVDSCLSADRESVDVDVEVIVIDSESDDGSWEALCRRFAADHRVRLIQNRRGVGPTRSWLDGGKLIRGDFVTFVWSDDYISSDFLTELVPPLRAGGVLAIGRGLVRGIDDESTLPSVGGSKQISLARYLSGYFLGGQDDIDRPVSPVCSLFARSVFDSWVTLVEEQCRATPLRQRFMWDSAIGPDLLLYLVALSQTAGTITVVMSYTAQFSSHAGSISIASSQWTMRTGYWLARICFLSGKLSDGLLPPRLFARCLSIDFLRGIVLAAWVRGEARGGGTMNASLILVIRELRRLWSIVRRHHATVAVLQYILSEVFWRVGRILVPRKQKSATFGS